MPEDDSPEPERHQKHHKTHSGHHAEQAGKASQDARARTDSGQHRVAGARGDRGHHGEEKKRYDLLRRRMPPPRIERSL